MPSYKRPGVYISEFLTPANTPVSTGEGRAVFLGEHHRGPTDEPVLVQSWSQFASAFGGFPPSGTTPTELPFAVYNFFLNGGRSAYVCRVLGSGSAVSTANLADQEATTPVDTLQVDALNAGAWGDNIRIDVVHRDQPNGRFDLVVKYGGTTDADVVERWNDLSMDDTDSRFVETVINSETAGSDYIKVTDLDSATASPQDAPAEATGAALTGGSDGTAASESEKSAAVTDGTSLMDDLERGTYVVNYPGETTAAVISALTTYCEDKGTFFALLDTDSGQTPAQAVTYTDGLTPSPYAAVYYPWVSVKDPTTKAPGATRLCPPGPLIAGKIAETDTQVGPWKAPAGLGTRLSGVVSLERQFRPADLDSLNEGHVNAIRRAPGSGTVVMGARTLETSTADKYVNVRRMLNHVKYVLTVSTEYALFENNDHVLWDRLSSTCGKILGSLHQQGGLRGETPGEAFYVKCDEELNTPAVIASGQVKIEIGVALQFPAEFIVIRIGQWESGGTATEAA